MANLARFLVAQTEAAARAVSRGGGLVSGIVLRLDGSQVMVNIGGQTVACQPTAGLPLLAGDQVWVRQGSHQPMIVGVGTRNNEVS